MAGEGKLQAYFKRRCAEENIFWRKIAFEGQRGCPDILVAKGGKVIFVELKNPNGKGVAAALQVAQMKKMVDAELDVAVIQTKEGVDYVIEELKEA